MVEAVQAQQPQLAPFTTLKYTTKDGENITATKNNGIVTLVGDKNGTRQMPMEDFKKELATTLPKLERTPETDSVELSAAKAPAEPAKTEDAPKPEENKVEDKAPAEPKPETNEAGKKLDIAA